MIDRDYWTDKQISMLTEWVANGDGKIVRGVAMSNPKFELWLLAHFQELPIQCGAAECVRLLKRHLPVYDKHFDGLIVSQEMMESAIKQSTPDMPVNCIGTNVGILVDRITHEAFMANSEERR